MEIKDIIEHQKKFDERHGWKWESENEREMVERLKYATIALSGEVGEFANVLKKALREKFPHGETIDEEKLGKMRGELVDVFIYTIIASRILKLDIEKEYLKKIDELEERFKKFEKGAP